MPLARELLELLSSEHLQATDPESGSTLDPEVLRPRGPSWAHRLAGFWAQLGQTWPDLWGATVYLDEDISSVKMEVAIRKAIVVM